MPGLARYSRPFITPSYGYYNCDCEPVNGYQFIMFVGTISDYHMLRKQLGFGE